MQGIELCKKYYETYGTAMLQDQFGSVAHRIAVGLVGEGSECLGFDDEISQDHDFEPGFCLFITQEDYKAFGFTLERAYTKLPKHFFGFQRSALSPVGGNRHGVLVIEDFYSRFLGTPTAPVSISQWFSLPSSALRAATSGEIWRDDLGVFSETRSALQKGYPEDIRLKKLAAHTAFMAQAGQYNLLRCLSRQEKGAAQLCWGEFVRHAISAIYLLNNTYEPFYKWAFRGMRQLPILAQLEDTLTLSGADNPALAEEIANAFCDAFRKQKISANSTSDLIAHAYAITEHIKDSQIRNMHIMAGI